MTRSSSSNVRPVTAEYPEPVPHDAQAADRSSNVRRVDGESDRVARVPHVSERSSNVHPRSPHAQAAHHAAERSSNAETRTSGELVQLRLSDGPAREHVRSANLYEINEPIALACDTDAPVNVVCNVLTSDGQTVQPSVTRRGTTWTASFRSTVPGDYWYAFDAIDNAGEIVASAERHFVVRKSRVPR